MKPQWEYDVLQLHHGADIPERLKEFTQKGWEIITASAMEGLHTIYLKRQRGSEHTNGQ